MRLHTEMWKKAELFDTDNFGVMYDAAIDNQNKDPKCSFSFMTNNT